MVRWLQEHKAWRDDITEDGSFGCVTVQYGVMMLSRDLLDSMAEIHFLQKCGIDLETSRILDIGAGYGRLAHRIISAFPGAQVVCTDAIGISREICSKYLCSRAIPLSQWSVMHPDRIQGLRGVDLAMNVHSWSECTINEIQWWLAQLRELRVPRLFVLPHDPSFASYEGVSFRPAIEAAGYRMVRHWMGPDPYKKMYSMWELHVRR
jgi:hypothetical protein